MVIYYIFLGYDMCFVYNYVFSLNKIFKLNLNYLYKFINLL